MPLSRRTFLLVELMTEPAVVELDPTDDNVKPGMPTTPWLLEVSPPPTFAPVALAVCKVAPVAPPAVFTTFPAVEATPPTNPRLPPVGVR